MKVIVCLDWKNHGGSVVEELNADSFDDAITKVGWKKMAADIKRCKKEGYPPSNISVMRFESKKYSFDKAKKIAEGK